MPILDVELVCASEPVAPRMLAKSLADQVAAVLGARPGSTWVKVHLLAADAYAEDGPQLDADDLPVFVKVLHRVALDGDALAAEVALLTTAIADVLNRPRERVHLEYLPSARGRQSFGGRVVE